MGDGPKKVGAGFFQAGFRQLLFPFSDEFWLCGWMGDQSADEYGDGGHAQKCDEETAGRDVLSQPQPQYGEKRTEKAVEIPYGVAGYDDEAENEQ